ncbi:serine/threonine-protein phosphatase 7 long form homolog [Glycine soja]|uniref:serine/threonine-protein phosphatase 7 long form homolog n=1 Tax=Glycine soja TaxID=3848 RepID=UPI0010393F51|nr:serine/threonine-protein phosphatase 7 long form homolog [Glycine soja]
MSDGFCGTHLQIMVGTRGLGRALGQVTRRDVGRGDHDDSDDAPQRRRPTASAQRQRVAATADHVDDLVIPDLDVQDDPMEAPAAVEDIPADAGALRISLRDFRVERPELKLSSHGRKVHSLGRPTPAIEGLIAGTGLSPLIACSVDTGDQGLLSAFVERWHRETSSFHLPVRELTITLDDVSSLLHLPVIGDFHAFEPLHVDDAVQMLVDLLMMSPESTRTETVQCHGSYVCLQWCWIYEHFPSVVESTANQDYDEASPRACGWIATKKTVKSIRTPSYRERLDRLWISDVCWIPYGEHREVRDFHVRSCYSGLLRWGPVAVYYRPERVVRQIGYTQTIPAPPVDSWVSYDDIHDRWMHYEDHIVLAGEVCVVPGACSSDYIDWFFRISHPFMTPGHAVDPLPHGHAP